MTKIPLGKSASFYSPIWGIIHLNRATTLVASPRGEHGLACRFKSFRILAFLLIRRGIGFYQFCSTTLGME